MKHFSMKQITYTIFLCFCCFTGPVSYAKTPPALSQLIKEATQNNPQIRAARDRLLAAIHVIPQAKALPDPKLNAGYINMSENIPMDVDPRREQMLGGQQEIPFPGKLIVRGRIATLEAKRAEAEYQATSFAVIAELKRLYYDLYFVNKSIEIVQRNQELLHEMEKSSEANYSVGKTPQQDIYRAQTEISRLLMRLVILKQQRGSLQADINRLLNRSLEITIHTPAVLPVTPMGHNLEYFYTLVKSRAPQLIMQQRAVQKGRQAIRLSKMEYFPDVEIEGGRLHDTGMHTKGYQVLLKATVPLYFMQKQNHAVRESLARYNADIEDLQTTYRMLSFQVKNAYLLAERSAKLIHLIQHTIIPQASLTFTSSQATYGVGKVDFLTMLNNLLTLQENELEWHGELAEHEKAIAQIEESTGTFL
ncbi:TPA: TolC family protein [Legionella pneumophila subsp. pneumophila]|nr:TolC family protein [Legionella pneumophila subsp. pneumophila]HAT9384730.1 TolC family protein [Legionella pneumophila subsp. pneumophila]HAT9789138.1 TolC family protein [Legionella pneumophila subsp. pneumophila]HAT9821314.1 TolC family protein [Legionella pneumophila subsp. pneumophila]HAT9923900.1 TolC family protein [Legionella pneumophila subsp. pneumophila]